MERNVLCNLVLQIIFEYGIVELPSFFSISNTTSGAEDSYDDVTLHKSCNDSG